jgi:Na+-driven multidrug efflux pump
VGLLAEHLKEDDVAGASATLSSSLFVAAAGGAAIGLAYLLQGPLLLRLTRADAAVLPHAAKYLRIRALALPAVIVAQVSATAVVGHRICRNLSPAWWYMQLPG